MSALELLDAAIAKVDAMIGVPPKSAAAAAPAAPAKPAPAAAPAPAAKAPAPAKGKEAKAAAAPAAAPAEGDVAALYQKVLIKVAKVVTVELLENSEKLYKLQVDVGGGEMRQVCAGLRQYLPVEALQGALVCAVCNLKPAKLAGNLSEAMLLAGEGEGASGRIVRTLVPPPGSAPGDQVYLEGGSPASDTPKQVKSDHFKAVAAALRVGAGNTATLGGRPLVTAAGAVTLPAEIPEGAAIH